MNIQFYLFIIYLFLYILNTCEILKYNECINKSLPYLTLPIYSTTTDNELYRSYRYFTHLQCTPPPISSESKASTESVVPSQFIESLQCPQHRPYLLIMSAILQVSPLLGVTIGLPLFFTRRLYLDLSFKSYIFLAKLNTEIGVYCIYS